MDTIKFSRVAESLRQYRRAELKDFIPETSENPIDDLYVDPLPSNAVLTTVLSSNTTFLTGRKGTGKSTIFAKAQSEIRKRNDLISVYIDVKSLHERGVSTQPVVMDGKLAGIEPAIYQAHMLRNFLGETLSQLLIELEKACEAMTLVQRWTGRKRGYKELTKKLQSIAERVNRGDLHEEELPILRQITAKAKSRDESESQKSRSAKLSATAGRGKVPAPLSMSAELGNTHFSKTLHDSELYNEYSDVVLRSFPFNQIITEITDLLDEANLLRLVVFFDDFSELEWVSQRLFVDVILSPLNNATNERIKLKIAGYPGRVYYGRIDPGKVDTVCLDFAELYKSNELQSAEASAINYTQRLLDRRFDAFGIDLKSYLESQNSTDDIFKLLFHVSMNVPRLLGYILHHCFLDRISKGQPINAASIRLAANKYYTTVVSQYFDKAGRFALEPFEQKLDRHNQNKLLRALLNESVDLKKRINRGDVGGTYFAELGGNPPVSHFYIDPKLESVLSSLEFNFLVTKYSETRDKNGRDVVVYAFLYGLAEAEKFAWGYPPGRDFRNYFVQRCFDYNSVIHSFLSTTSTIRCDACGTCYSMDDREKIEFYSWKCRSCNEGICAVINLSDDFESEVALLDQSLMLDQVDLEVLTVLNESDDWMRAGDISLLIDQSYQLIGKRTKILQDRGLVEKNQVDGHRKSKITQRAISTYFPEADS